MTAENVSCDPKLSRKANRHLRSEDAEDLAAVRLAMRETGTRLSLAELRDLLQQQCTKGEA